MHHELMEFLFTQTEFLFSKNQKLTAVNFKSYMCLSVIVFLKSFLCFKLELCMFDLGKMSSCFPQTLYDSNFSG